MLSTSGTRKKTPNKMQQGAQNAQNAPVCFSDDFFFIFIPPLFSLAGILPPGLFDVLSIALQKTQIPPFFCLLTPKCIAFFARFWQAAQNLTVVLAKTYKCNAAKLCKP